ncbi:MAG: hypothetical protein MHM6MM_002801 [Cercozoa sp. M6MM]
MAPQWIRRTRVSPRMAWSALLAAVFLTVLAVLLSGHRCAPTPLVVFSESVVDKETFALEKLSLTELQPLVRSRLKQHMQRPASVLERTVWTYWEGDLPVYMPLLMRTCSFHHGKRFQVINRDAAYAVLTKYWREQYTQEHPSASVKETSEYAESLWQTLLRVLPAQRSDVIRQTWLQVYGGVWLDADTFCLRDVSPAMLDTIGAGSGDSRVASVYNNPTAPALPKIVAFCNEITFSARAGALPAGAKELRNRLETVLREQPGSGRAWVEWRHFGLDVLKPNLPPKAAVVPLEGTRVRPRERFDYRWDHPDVMLYRNVTLEELLPGPEEGNGDYDHDTNVLVIWFFNHVVENGDLDVEEMLHPDSVFCLLVAHSLQVPAEQLSQLGGDNDGSGRVCATQ